MARILGRAYLLLLLLAAPIARADTFVLVHGAFVGNWYWDPLKTGLEERGHKVIVATLLGSVDHDVDDPAAVTLDNHVTNIVTAIESADEPVILVAHSYGGRPATGAWDIARDRIKGVILLEAVAPYGPAEIAIPEELTQRMLLAETAPDVLARGYIDPPDYLSERYPGRTVTPQSIAALHAPVVLTRSPLPATPGAYVLGEESDATIFRQYAARIAEQRGWTIYEIESGHDMVFDASDVLTRLLIDVATQIDASQGQ